MYGPLRPILGIPHTEYMEGSLGSWLYVDNSFSEIFRVNHDIVDEFPVMIFLNYTSSRKVNMTKLILSYLQERYDADRFYYVFLEPFAKSIIESVYEYTVNAETGEVLESRPGVVSVGEDHALYICVSKDACIVPMYNCKELGDDYADDFLGDLHDRTQQLVSALDVRVFPAFTEDYFKKIIREKFVPFFENKLKERAYEVMVKSLRKEYGFSCKKEDEFTICERVMDVHYVEDSNGNKVPVLKAMTIKIQNPDSKDADYWLRRDTSI